MNNTLLENAKDVAIIIQKSLEVSGKFTEMGQMVMLYQKLNHSNTR